MFHCEGRDDKMKKRKTAICFIIFIFLYVLFYCLSCSNDNTYSATTESYIENNSYVEYPQIEGLKNIKKQDNINKLLKEQVFLGAKNYENKTFVDFSNPNCVYEFSIEVGLVNEYIANFLYSFSAYDKSGSGKFGFKGYTDRFFGVTVDMKSGKKIELSDFMVIDNRLINSTDGDDTLPDYNSSVNPTFHKFKDAFMIFTAEDKSDVFHLFTPQEIISRLKNNEYETNWYIDEDKNIVFLSNSNFIKIPYTRIADIIYPKYLAMLKN